MLSPNLRSEFGSTRRACGNETNANDTEIFLKGYKISKAFVILIWGDARVAKGGGL